MKSPANKLETIVGVWSVVPGWCRYVGRKAENVCGHEIPHDLPSRRQWSVLLAVRYQQTRRPNSQNDTISTWGSLRLNFDGRATYIRKCRLNLLSRTQELSWYANFAAYK